MAVQVWIGEKPEHPNERRAIMALATGLERLEGLYLILANFSVGGRTVDLVIVKNDAIFIIELKHCDGRVLGSVNGPWFVEGRNGERKRLNPGRKNPYNQVISYFHALTNFLNEHRRAFLSDQKASDIDFRTCKRVVVIAPSIQEGSEIELDWKVELKGLDDLPAYLITERSSEIELADEEMLKIPELLHCTPWAEVNTVLRGVLADDAPSAPVAVAPAEPAPADSAPAEPAAPASLEPTPAGAPPSLLARTQGALRTTTGRIAATMAGVAAILLAVLIFRPVQVVAPSPEGPLPFAGVSGAPTDGTAPLGAAVELAGCSWSGFQLVGKRYDSATRSWSSVAVGEAAALLPDVVIALEQVTTCDNQIELTWSVQNNSDQPVEFPLRSDNIRINDGLGNEYLIANEASQPRAVRVAPGDQGRGTAIVKRPVSQSATSLFVRLRDKPFGEASFVVSLSP